jgi:predicted nuclease of predicted toxin-antitoxin system
VTFGTPTCCGERRDVCLSCRTGNISNDDLLALFNEHLAAIVAAFGDAEMSP